MERPRRIMTSEMVIEDKNYVHQLEQYCNYIEESNRSLVNQVFRLSRSKRLLNALEEAGVDNWEGYERAQQIYFEGED